MSISHGHYEKASTAHPSLAFARPRAITLSDARKGAAQDNVRYLAAIFVAAAASVGLLALVSSLGAVT